MDKLELEVAIKRKGYTIGEFCEKIGMSRTAFYRKCNGISEFTLSEINTIVAELNLTSPVGIFFAHEVS